ncbi:hypothetical protein DFS34DRAFT_445025 [Phlyctochytrium arcticum]|nr:hypothetical protein DFS34DRAFT_445025 [Phlyctochytrium arcticum]
MNVLGKSIEIFRSADFIYIFLNVKPVWGGGPKKSQTIATKATFLCCVSQHTINKQVVRNLGFKKNLLGWSFSIDIFAPRLCTKYTKQNCKCTSHSKNGLRNGANNHIRRTPHQPVERGYLLGGVKSKKLQQHVNRRNMYHNQQHVCWSPKTRRRAICFGTEGYWVEMRLKVHGVCLRFGILMFGKTICQREITIAKQQSIQQSRTMSQNSTTTVPSILMIANHPRTIPPKRSGESLTRILFQDARRYFCQGNSIAVSRIVGLPFNGKKQDQ